MNPFQGAGSSEVEHEAPKNPGFRVLGLGFTVWFQGLGFRVWVQGLGLRVLFQGWGSGFRV